MTFMASQTANEIWVQEGDERRKLEGAELQNFLEHAAELEAKHEAEETAKAEAKAKRDALLQKLGITEEDARLLLG